MIQQVSVMSNKVLTSIGTVWVIWRNASWGLIDLSQVSRTISLHPERINDSLFVCHSMNPFYQNKTLWFFWRTKKPPRVGRDLKPTQASHLRGLVHLIPHADESLQLSVRFPSSGWGGAFSSPRALLRDQRGPGFELPADEGNLLLCVVMAAFVGQLLRCIGSFGRVHAARREWGGSMRPDHFEFTDLARRPAAYRKPAFFVPLLYFRYKWQQHRVKPAPIFCILTRPPHVRLEASLPYGPDQLPMFPTQVCVSEDEYEQCPNSCPAPLAPVLLTRMRIICQLE